MSCLLSFEFHAFCSDGEQCNYPEATVLKFNEYITIKFYFHKVVTDFEKLPIYHLAFLRLYNLCFWTVVELYRLEIF